MYIKEKPQCKEMSFKWCQNPVKVNHNYQFYKKEDDPKNQVFDLRFDQIKESPINQAGYKQAYKALGFQFKKYFKQHDYSVVKNQAPNFNTKDDEIRALWIGHASILLSIGGKMNILIDPMFQNRVVPIVGEKRAVDLPCKIEDLPQIHAVLLSHDHYDHWNTETLKQIYERSPQKTLFVVGRNSSDILPKGSQRFELSWTQSIQTSIDQLLVKVTFVPACHWGKRTLTDQNTRLWGGYVIEVGNKKVYFAGDTGNCEIFKQLKQQFKGFDLSLLPIGAYQPNQMLHAQHINPRQAVIIHKQIQSKKSVGIHWGTFSMSHESPVQVLKDLQLALQAEEVKQQDFITLCIGGSTTIKI